MHLLPTNLAALSEITDPNSYRFALGCINLKLKEENGEQSFSAEATNTHILLKVEGPTVGKLEDYPIFPALEAAPNSATAGLIPAKFWNKSFKDAAVFTKKFPKLRSVAVKLGENLATFGTTDTESSKAEQTKLSESRFPNTDDIIPKVTGETKSVYLDAKQLIAALETIKALVPTESGSARVRFDITEGNKPIGLSASSGTLNVTGCIMPLTA
jgi:hypothetical protein